MKRAYHDIRLPDGTLQEGPIVVETDSRGRCLCWHPLGDETNTTPMSPHTRWRTHGEEPATEWVGGIYTLHTHPTNDKKKKTAKRSRV